MLDSTSPAYLHWNDWKQSEGQILQFQYFLGNQRVVNTETKPFLITEGTKLQVEKVVLGESIDVLVSGIKFRILRLIVDIPKNTLKYQSGEDLLSYETGGTAQENFMRSWFTEIKKDSD